jgi:hypothetical protein
MSFAFPHYITIKNNYCCSYLGNNPEYVVQLKLLRPYIEKQLPGIKIFITCKDSFMYLLEGEDKVFPISILKERKYDFAYIREIQFKDKHPIHEFMLESDLKIEPICIDSCEERGLALICPESLPPTISLKEKDVVYLKTLLLQQGYSPMVLGSDIHSILPITTRPYGKDKLKYIEEAKVIVGVENEYLFLGASMGKGTWLIPTGKGSELYQKMFPAGKLIKI